MGSTLRVRLADFNIAKMHGPEGTPQMGVSFQAGTIPRQLPLLRAGRRGGALSVHGADGGPIQKLFGFVRSWLGPRQH